jgi:hypothetical protein
MDQKPFWETDSRSNLQEIHRRVHYSPSTDNAGLLTLLNSLWNMYTLTQQPGSSVSIVSDYGLDDRATEIRSPSEAKGFFL